MPDGASGYPAELAKRRFRLPWRSERRRTVLPELSIVAIGLIVLLLGALLAAIHRSEVDDERQALIKSTLWAEQHLHFQFASIEGKLAQLAALLGHDGYPTEMFQVQVRHLVRTEAEIERVLWLDAAGVIALETPPAEDAGGLPQASHNAFVMARSAGQRAYSAPLTTRGGAAGFEIQVPVFDAAGFAGTLVAQLSLRALLEEHLPWWFAERYRLEITDPLGVVLASKSRVPADDGGRSYAIALEPPGHGLMLVTTVYRAETHLTRNFLVAAILALAFATAWSLWSARRHIGRRLRAERALRAEYAFRKAMEDSLTVGMRARDLSGRITYVNPAFCRMVGWSAAELIGRAPPMPYWVPEDMERTLILHDAVLSGKAPSQGFEIRFRRRNGERFDALIYEAPLIGPDGRQTGWMGSVLDITERKRADELARQQSEKLQHTSRLVVMGEMASALAHELNQPLSAIASYATGCLNRLRAGDTAPGELTPALEKLGRQAQRAGHIIRRVHGFARKSEPRMEPCDVAAILEDCRELMHPDADRRGVRIAVDPVPDLPWIDADAIQIGQVLLNLARNGMEAMAQTPKDRRLLRMSARAEDGSVLFSVTDCGPGIPPDVAAQLFTPFFTTKEEGMGMGLNICRSIVEHHRGRLWFETPPEGGCIFHFLLPAVKP